MALLDEVMVAVDGGRGVRDRRRVRVLQRDRGVPGGLRSAPGAGVDGRADPLVRRAAGPRPVQRQLPGASRRDHAAARRVAGRGRRGAAGVRAAAPARSAGGRCRVLPAGRAAPALRRVRAGRGGRTARPAGAGESRSPAWRGCGWPRGRSDAAEAAIRRAVDGARDRAARARLLPALVEIMLAADDVLAARAAADELSETGRRARRAAAARAGHPCGGRGPAARGRRAGRARQRCAMRGRRGRRSRCRTRPRGPAS